MLLENIIIDEEFRDLLPAMDRRKELAEKIEAEGWTDEPITVWQHHNILLDGHNRYAIWQSRNDDGPQVRELKFDSREEAELWVRKHQDSRRNSTDEHKKYNIGRIHELEKKVRGAPEGNTNNRKVKPASLAGLTSTPDDKPSGDTAKRIAEEQGVSERKVYVSRDYANAIDSLDSRGVINKADVLSGNVKIPASREEAMYEPFERKAAKGRQREGNKSGGETAGRGRPNRFTENCSKPIDDAPQPRSKNETANRVAQAVGTSGRTLLDQMRPHYF